MFTVHAGDLGPNFVFGNDLFVGDGIDAGEHAAAGADDEEGWAESLVQVRAMFSGPIVGNDATKKGQRLRETP